METDWSNSTAAVMGKLPPLEGLYHALLHEGRSVLMVSDDDALLETCGQSVVRKLRQSPDVQVTAMFDLDREVLLQRFNRLLENLSVDEALKKDASQPTLQVWLQQIHNSQELEQAKLLIRLCTDFPAAGIKLLLMANHVCADDLIHHGQSKKMLVWHAPTMQKAAASKTVMTEDAPAQLNPHWMDAAHAEPQMDVSFTKPLVSSTRSNPARKSQRWVAQLLVGVFVVVSGVVLGLNQWQNPTPSASPTAQSQSEPAQKPAQEPVAPTVNVTNEAPPPVPAAVSAPLPVPDVVAVEPPRLETPTAAQTVSEPKPVPSSAIQWALNLRATDWVVQHVALDSMNEVQAWQAQHPALVDARVVPMRRPTGQTYWVLVSGPFVNVDQANAFGKKPGVPQKPWSRAVASLQANLDKKP